MPKIGARITDQTAEFLRSTFGSVNAGGEYIAGAFPALYQRTLRDLRGIFSVDDLSLMIDCHNGSVLIPGMAGQHLEIAVRDSMELDDIDAKWGVDRKKMMDRIRQLNLFDRSCLEIWSCAYWSSGPGDLRKYVTSLT